MKEAQALPRGTSKWALVLTSLQSRDFRTAAQTLAELALEGDSDAAWVLNDPEDSPVSEPYFRYCAGACIRTTLGNLASALPWLKMAAGGMVADACLEIAQIAWSYSNTNDTVLVDHETALIYLMRAVAILDLGHGKGGIDQPATSVNRTETCILISECFAYGVGAPSNAEKAVEWLEKAWNGRSSGGGIVGSLSLFAEAKTSDQKRAAKLLGVWFSTGKLPAEASELPRVLRSGSCCELAIDLDKAQIWGKRSL
ncbi:hypothetical protein HDU98_008277 [Podochytrium sp. JEL0797]|nr:hypothetical protein HDU98_008277 [Podochytrium sp. JEL0797]